MNDTKNRGRMIANFGDVLDAARELGPVRAAIAAAQDRDVMLAVMQAQRQGLVDPILVGDEKLIRPLASELGLPASTPVIHEPNVEKAAATAVWLVRGREAQILVKGMINTSTLLHAALNPDRGLRSGRMLAHLAAFQIPGQPKLVYHTDGGMNICPNLHEKTKF